MIWIHLSELSVDRLLAGELSSGDADAMRDHAGGCARCGTDWIRPRGRPTAR